MSERGFEKVRRNVGWFDTADGHGSGKSPKVVIHFAVFVDHIDIASSLRTIARIGGKTHDNITICSEGLRDDSMTTYEDAVNGRAFNVLVRLALPLYTLHFKDPAYTQDATMEMLDQKVKMGLKATGQKPEVKWVISWTLQLGSY